MKGSCRGDNDVGIDKDLDIDSDIAVSVIWGSFTGAYKSYMAVSLNWGSFGGSGALKTTALGSLIFGNSPVAKRSPKLPGAPDSGIPRPQLYAT